MRRAAPQPRLSMIASSRAPPGSTNRFLSNGRGPVAALVSPPHAFRLPAQEQNRLSLGWAPWFLEILHADEPAGPDHAETRACSARDHFGLGVDLQAAPLAAA